MNFRPSYHHGFFHKLSKFQDYLGIDVHEESFPNPNAVVIVPYYIDTGIRTRIVV